MFDREHLYHLRTEANVVLQLLNNIFVDLEDGPSQNHHTRTLREVLNNATHFYY